MDICILFTDNLIHQTSKNNRHHNIRKRLHYLLCCRIHINLRGHDALMVCYLFRYVDSVAIGNLSDYVVPDVMEPAVINLCCAHSHFP